MTSGNGWDKIRFSSPAARDLSEIFLHTLVTWGPVQLGAYEEKLHKAFLMIVRHPGIGRLIPDDPKSRRVFGVGSHLIVYRASGSGILITRILHDRMNTLDKALQGA